MGKLLVVGTVAFDAIETPFGKTDKILGGAATYIGLSASNYDVPVGIVSVIGDDFPDEDIELLKSRNIDVSGIEIVKGGKTFFWHGRYHNDMNSRDTLDTQLNVLEKFNPIVPNNYKDADVVMLGNLHPSVQLSVLQQMEKRPKLVVLDTMNFWMDTTMDELKKVIAQVDAITINDEEARQLSGEYSLVKAARIIQDMGPKYVVIKKGEHGAFLFYQGQVFFAPALPLEEVMDPTGAGDTFAGGFTGFVASSNDYSFENLKKAIVHGSNLASFCVEKFGTERMKEITKDEINTRLLHFKELTQFEIDLA